MVDKIVDSIKKHAKPCVFFLVACFVVVCFSNVINAWFVKDCLWLFDDVSDSGFATVLFTIICFIAIGSLFVQWDKRYCLPDSFVFILSVIVFTYYYFKIDYHYIAHPEFKWGVGYGEVITALLGASVIISIISSFRKQSPKEILELNKTKVPFELDRPIEKESEDRLNHTTLATDIAERIKITPSDSAFSIALIAPWGHGKSSFINLMLSQFESDEYLTIRFNPRHASNDVSIQQSFFNSLKDQISVHDGQFSSAMGQYLEALSIVEIGLINKMIGAVESIMGVEGHKEALTNIISRHWTKVVVVMEDFDRLTGEELIETLKLIDGNAAIGGLVFVCAFDKHNIATALQQYESNFIDKYFDVEFTLPHRPYNEIFDYISNKLSGIIGKDTKTKQEIENCREIFNQYLPSFRDAKRFINNVSVSYPYIEGEVEIKDFLLVEVIKLVDNETFLQLKQGNLIDKWHSVPNENLEEIFNPLPATTNILEKLLKGKKSQISFNNSQHYYIYIWDYVYGKLKYKDLDALMNPSNDFKSRFSEYFNSENSGEKEQLFGYLQQFYEYAFDDSRELKRYVDLVVYPFILNPLGSTSAYEYYPLVLHLLHEERMLSIIDKCKMHAEEYKRMIKDNLIGTNESDIPAYLNLQIIYSVLTDNSMKKILTHTEILDINCTNFKKYCQSQSQYSLLIRCLLSGCIDSINSQSNKVKLNVECCAIAKGIILKDLASYFDKFVFLTDWDATGISNDIGCDAYWYQIFGSAEEIERCINSLGRAYILVKNFWTLYKANDYNPLYFEDGRAQQRIDDKLTNEIKRYNEFQNIRKSYEELETNYQFGIIDQTEYRGALSSIIKILNTEIRLNNISEISNFHKSVYDILHTK